MRAILLLMLCLASFWSHAQTINVSGTVTEAETGTPLLGVNVIIKGTSTGTTTDFDGNFLLSDVPTRSVLVFTYIGFKELELTVTSSTPLSIEMQPDTQALDEVVLIGYGEQDVKEVTGAIGVLESKAIEKLNPVVLEQALQGQLAGVNVTSNSGSPGSGLNIRIRGISTNGNNDPLIIIDGAVVEGGLSVINPTDVKSITVLKDASAAIYGVRAANGVILIQTKNGRKGTAPTLSYDAYYGFQETTRKIPVLNATEYALLANEAHAAGGQQLPFPDVSGLGQGTDWQDEVFKTTPIFNHVLSLTGGGEKTNYKIGGSVLDQDGIVGGGDKSSYKRYTADVKLGIDINDHWRVETNLFYTHEQRRQLLENTLGSVLFNAINNAPTFPVFDENGEFSKSENLGNEVINPVAQIANTYNDRQVNKFFGLFKLRYTLNETFNIESRIGFNYAEERDREFFPIVDYGNGKVFNNDRSRVTQDANQFNDYNWETFLTYKNTFGEAHNLTAMVGSTLFQEKGSFLSATGYDVPNNSWEFADIGQTTGNPPSKNVDSSSFDVRLVSFFGRVQYNYNSKYLLTAAIRRDGSTRFGSDNRFNWFPSITAGWVMSSENFLESADWLTQLKLRGGFATVGNDRLQRDVAYRALLDGEATYVFNGQLVNGRAIGLLPNAAVQWEENDNINIGFDSSFFNNTLSFTMDYYQRKTRELLLEGAQVSGILGASAPGSGAPALNAGTVRNQGFEFDIGYANSTTGGFNYGISFNLTTIDNEVLEVNNDQGFLEGGQFGVGQDPPARMQGGLPLGYFYGLKTDGVFQTQAEVDAHATQQNAQAGDLRFVDINGDGQITEADRTNVGDPIPDVTMGFNFNFDYKRVDFNLSAFASIGNDLIRNYQRFEPLTNRTVYFLDRWTGPGTTNSFHRVTTGPNKNIDFSDFYVEDASYLRIQNIQLGYTLAPEFSKKAGMEKLRIYASVNNPFTFTEYSGYDPAASQSDPDDVIGAGVDYGFYPVARVYLFGINVIF